jgi:2-succinyl-5-enolpyruvyl-6-hydroxy-3-cyclohexene-1-carboxylate synthase
MTNLEVANAILQSLARQGLKQVCICAGSRNSPFIEILDQQSQLRVFSFFEEREAAFFAYQQIKEHNLLTAVITTSGTAVAELLPACVEAFYKQIPLLLITADRPKEFRGSGAPQAIEQVGIFSNYAACLDIDTDSFTDITLDQAKPNHINVCFAEPLLAGETPKWKPATGFKPLAPKIITKSCQQEIKNPLVIVGDIFTIDEEMQALQFLSHCQSPILLESISNLRGKLKSPYTLMSHDLGVESMINAKQIESIVRIGGVPTTSIWRRLETKFKHLPVYTFSHVPFLGLTHAKQIYSYSLVTLKNQYVSAILEADMAIAKKVEALLKAYPRSEAGMVKALSEQMDNNDNLYLGNSLPIREWDLFSQKDLLIKRVGANRGANGIDGQISSFYGFSHPNSRNIGVFGDLTAMYGMSAPWLLKQLPEHQQHVMIIINNSGGQIFSKMYESKTYLNSHSHSFEALAAFWHLPYFNFKNIQALPHSNAIVEIIPDPNETKAFDQELRT